MPTNNLLYVLQFGSYRLSLRWREIYCIPMRVFLFGFLVLLSSLLLYYICYILPYHSCSILPVSCSYNIIPYMFPAWYHLLFLYMFLYACVHDTIFSTCSLTRIYRYTCAYLYTPLDIYHTTRWGVSDSTGFSCPDSGDWSLWILSVAG